MWASQGSGGEDSGSAMPFYAERRVAITGQRDDIRQRRPVPRIDGRQHKILLAKNFPFLQHDPPGGVGQYDAGVFIDEKDAGSEAT